MRNELPVVCKCHSASKGRHERALLVLGRDFSTSLRQVLFGIAIALTLAFDWSSMLAISSVKG